MAIKVTDNNGTYLSSHTRYKNPAMNGQSVKHFALREKVHRLSDLTVLLAFIFGTYCENPGFWA
ncbi:MAG: hypothetical protein ACI9LO_002073 [Planctomycetota bacterium]|jgi:hypothetical protein